MVWMTNVATNWKCGYIFVAFDLIINPALLYKHLYHDMINWTFALFGKRMWKRIESYIYNYICLNMEHESPCYCVECIRRWQSPFSLCMKTYPLKINLRFDWSVDKFPKRDYLQFVKGTVLFVCFCYCTFYTKKC